MNGQQRGNVKQATGLILLRKPVRRTEEVQVVREATTGRVVSMLPRVWAVAERGTALVPRSDEQPVSQAALGALEAQPNVELAFYRKYTEAMLRRYVRVSMQAGRVPSLLGRELFRGHVTSYRVHGFEDAVIFCFDMEKRLKRLGPLDQQLIKRIGLQQYTHGEAAGILGLSLRNCIRQYGKALDELTEMLLEARMLEPLKSCQGGQAVENGTT